MASHGSLTVSTAAASPKGGSDCGKTAAGGGGGGQCLCSPTTHQGSFRCRFHRAPSSGWSKMMKRSYSMPANGSSDNNNNNNSSSPSSSAAVEST
ncbi:unnamed protein product [Linum tenue]|uniref:Uncharacterized protein n=2 Tax=Linum tenue TaxID=586396 RepID=A0AAV0QCW4_9ROSI|nr:unnamed protein product [Linum tenue]CAI0628935.1 unnamed protein product [Linum tenue]